MVYTEPKKARNVLKKLSDEASLIQTSSSALDQLLKKVNSISERDREEFLSTLRKGLSVKIVDFYHTSERLTRAFELAHGEKSTVTIQSYVKYRKILLKDKKVFSGLLTIWCTSFEKIRQNACSK